MERKIDDPLDPIKSAPPEIKRIIFKILEKESNRLYEMKPRGINADIVEIIKEEIT